MNSNIWEVGDFSKIAPAAQIVGEMLCDAIPVYAGDRVLDIGCGTGNTALAAARRKAQVSCTDPVPSLLEKARERAAFEGLAIEFREGGAEVCLLLRRGPLRWLDLAHLPASLS